VLAAMFCTDKITAIGGLDNATTALAFAKFLTDGRMKTLNTALNRWTFRFWCFVSFLAHRRGTIKISRARSISDIVMHFIVDLESMLR
jgi:hypothetical protein